MASAIRQSLRIVPIVASLAAGLAGCGGQLSTASSIRVEVDVYKGPLSLELDTQWAELLGVVNETEDVFEYMERSFRFLSMPMKKCKKLEYSEYKKYPSETWIVGDIGMGERHCYYLYGLKKEVEDIKKIRDAMLQSLEYSKNKPIRNQTAHDILNCRNNNTSGNCPKIKKILRDVSELAARLKAKALFWSQLMLISQSDSYVVRINMASTASGLAQYSNQMASRADALLKQLEGKLRQALPTSVYLRDTSTTDFPNLHAWNRAAAPALLSEMIIHPLSAFGSEETFDRIRVIERLFADHYWTNINTVYGSGQGEVRMALIKDDIGNWDLKSFDSDPTELVDAYKDITLAGLKAAASLAKEVAEDGATAGAAGALELAGRLARGQMGSDGAVAGQFNVEALHGRVVTRLQALKQDVENRKQALDERKRTLTGRISTLDTEIKEGEEQVQSQQGEVETSETRVDQLEAELRAARATPPPENARETGTIEAELNDANDALAIEREELAKARVAVAVKREERKGLKGQLDFTQEKLDALPSSIIEEMQSVIEDHEAVIDVLQESVVAQP